jgi:hypothetical protein
MFRTKQTYHILENLQNESRALGTQMGVHTGGKLPTFTRTLTKKVLTHPVP